MTISGTTTVAAVSTARNVLANLYSACNGIEATSMHPSSSHWYAQLLSELDGAKRVAHQWTTALAPSLDTSVLTSLIECGNAFQRERDAINALFEHAEVDPATNAPVVAEALRKLSSPMDAGDTAVAGYETKLRAWGVSMQAAHDQMYSTIAQVHSEEQGLQSAIAASNALVASMRSEIAADRKQIAEAKAHRGAGIAETIFGVLAAPFTGGLSLVLAGVGVTTIAGAQGHIAGLETTITSHLTKIVEQQHDMTQDQVQRTALQTLGLSAGVAIDDMTFALTTIQSVRTTFAGIHDELNSARSKIAKATSTDIVVLQKAWFNATCNEWDTIVSGLDDLLGASFQTQNVRTTGNAVPVVHLTEGSGPSVDSVWFGGFVGPDVSDLTSTTPVVHWQSSTWWFGIYADNRESMCVVHVDDATNTVRRVTDVPGARYPNAVEVDIARQVITCRGQNTQDHRPQSISLAFANLGIV